jgi:hypothetical protein
MEMINETINNMKEFGVFTHYLWTNNKTLIPETVEWAHSMGMVVKDIHEMANYDEKVGSIVL